MLDHSGRRELSRGEFERRGQQLLQIDGGGCGEGCFLDAGEPEFKERARCAGGGGVGEMIEERVEGSNPSRGKGRSPPIPALGGEGVGDFPKEGVLGAEVVEDQPFGAAGLT